LADDHRYRAVTARQRISDMRLAPDVDVQIPRVHRTYRDMGPDLEPMFRYFARG
jgi:hypothetical protein